MANPSAISISISPGITPLVCTASVVTLQEDDANAPGSFPSQNNPPGVPVWVTANDKVQTDQNLRVNLVWTMSGALNSFLAANYVCTAYFEKMGTGEASSNYSATTAHVPSAVPHSYSLNIPIPAGSLSDGVYRLVVSLITQSTGGVGFPIVGFTEIGLIQVYQS
jgi:hypothetical protein